VKKPVFLCASILLAVAGSAGAAPASARPRCPQLKNSASAQVLDRRVEAADGRAALCLAAGLHSLDGGELEDALIALGQFGDQRPAELLRLAHRGLLSKASLADAVQMLPLSMADDLHAQTTALRIRREQFAAVALPTLVAERDLAVRSIESTLADIMRHLGSR
jgi:hypothetical protein